MAKHKPTPDAELTNTTAPDPSDTTNNVGTTVSTTEKLPVDPGTPPPDTNTTIEEADALRTTVELSADIRKRYRVEIFAAKERTENGSNTAPPTAEPKSRLIRVFDVHLILCDLKSRVTGFSVGYYDNDPEARLRVLAPASMWNNKQGQRNITPHVTHQDRALRGLSSELRLLLMEAVERAFSASAPKASAQPARQP